MEVFKAAKNKWKLLEIHIFCKHQIISAMKKCGKHRKLLNRSAGFLCYHFLGNEKCYGLGVVHIFRSTGNLYDGLLRFRSPGTRGAKILIRKMWKVIFSYLSILVNKIESRDAKKADALSLCGLPEICIFSIIIRLFMSKFSYNCSTLPNFLFQIFIHLTSSRSFWNRKA